jgi:urease accessory protein UreE
MLHVFTSLPIVRDIHRADALPERARAYGRDLITLGWEERLKARGRRRSDGGLEFGTTLPRGTTLCAGDSFVFDEQAIVVTVAERLERVFVVEPPTPVEWGLFAYCIGNSHQPLMLTAAAIVCPDVPGMEQVLTYHGIAFSRSIRAFTPVSLGGELPGAGHQHNPERAP